MEDERSTVSESEGSEGEEIEPSFQIYEDEETGVVEMEFNGGSDNLLSVDGLASLFAWRTRSVLVGRHTNNNGSKPQQLRLVFCCWCPVENESALSLLLRFVRKHQRRIQSMEFVGDERHLGLQWHQMAQLVQATDGHLRELRLQSSNQEEEDAYIGLDALFDVLCGNRKHQLEKLTVDAGGGLVQTDNIRSVTQAIASNCQRLQEVDLTLGSASEEVLHLLLESLSTLDRACSKSLSLRHDGRISSSSSSISLPALTHFLRHVQPCCIRKLHLHDSPHLFDIDVPSVQDFCQTLHEFPPEDELRLEHVGLSPKTAQFLWQAAGTMDAPGLELVLSEHGFLQDEALEQLLQCLPRTRLRRLYGRDGKAANAWSDAQEAQMAAALQANTTLCHANFVFGSLVQTSYPDYVYADTQSGQCLLRRNQDISRVRQLLYGAKKAAATAPLLPTALGPHVLAKLGQSTAYGGATPSFMLVQSQFRTWLETTSVTHSKRRQQEHASGGATQPSPNKRPRSVSLNHHSQQQQC